MTSLNIFENASRQSLRFSTARGMLAADDLWKLPLTSKDDFNLDSIARGVATALAAETEGSFVKSVSTRQNASQARLELRLEILKHIISVKQEEIEARENETKRRQEADRIREILSKKQDKALEEASVEDLQARLNELTK